MPVWLHGLLRILLPLPCAAGAVALHVVAARALLRDPALPGRGWLVGAAVLLGVGVAVAGWLAPRLFLKALPVRCPRCGGDGRLSPREGAARGYACRGCDLLFESHWRPERLVSGLFALGMSVTVMVLIAAEQGPLKPKILGLALVSPFFVAGVALLGDAPLLRLVKRGLPWTEEVPWKPVVGGTIALALGVGFACVGLLGDLANMPAGRIPVVAAGCAFGLAGLSILLGQLHERSSGVTRARLYRAITVIGVLLLLSFAAAPLGIALHERGVGAVAPLVAGGIVLSLLVVVGVVALRRRRHRHRDPD